jgi:hypothetical protein
MLSASSSGKEELYRLALITSRCTRNFFSFFRFLRFRLCLRQWTAMGFCGDPAPQEVGAPVIREGGSWEPYYKRLRTQPRSHFLQLYFSALQLYLRLLRCSPLCISGWNHIFLVSRSAFFTNEPLELRFLSFYQTRLLFVNILSGASKNEIRTSGFQRN